MTPACGVRPVQQEARSVAGEPNPTQLAVAPRALVVDDERPIRCVIRRYFERRGWHVDEAEDGEAALGLLAATDRTVGREYDLIISDLRMERIGGAELHRWIAATRPEAIDRFVVTSGDVSDEGAAALIDGAGCRFLAKPFELSMLAELIRSTMPPVEQSRDRVA